MLFHYNKNAYAYDGYCDMIGSYTSMFKLLWVFILITFPIAGLAEFIEAERLVSGLDRPVYATTAPGDSSRLFIVEQHTGDIVVHNLDTGVTNSAPFLTVDNPASGGEQGLLGLAFHPDYKNNGLFYTNTTTTSNVSLIQKHQVSWKSGYCRSPQHLTRLEF